MQAPELRPWIASTGQDGSRYSMQEFAGDGVRTSFELNFAGGYIDPANVRAYTYVSATGAQTPVTVVLTGPNTISVVPAVPVGSFLVVYRDTDKSQPLVDFADGAVMSEANLDLVARQAVFAAAEMVDRFYVTEQSVSELTVQAQEATDRSELALTAAEAAKAAADYAVITAGDALAGVAGAEQAAISATAAAQAATTAANNANQTAADVRGIAQAAEDKADSAVTTANGVDAKAQTALDTANAATAAAVAATATANAVDGKAQMALDTAEHADQTATGAVSTANNAATLAGQVSSDLAATNADVQVLNTRIDKTLGAGQAWGDVSAARTLGVLYVNNTGHPIVVNASGLSLSSGASIVIYVDSRAAAVSYVTVAGVTLCGHVIVPAGSNYKITLTAASFAYWWEYR